MIEYAEFLCSFGLTTFVGSLIISLYIFTMLNDTHNKTCESIDNVVNHCNFKLKIAKYSERQKFATLIQMRLNAYNTVLKTRQECIEKLKSKMSMSLEDIIDTRKTIKRMEIKLEKYNRKMAIYPVFQLIFPVPQKNDYNPTHQQNIRTNGETSDKLVKKTGGVQSGDTNTESSVSSVSLDNSPARS